MLVKENILRIKEKIADAAVKAGRNPNEITLVAVSKTFPYNYVNEAYLAGVKNFGENYVQDFLTKYDELKDKDIKWHFIGHLQRNKIKYIIDKIYMLHTLDSVRLAKNLNEKLESADKQLRVLVQINIGEESAKNGIHPEEAENFLDELQTLSNLKVEGIMAIPPYFSESEKVRPYFNRMRNLFDKLKKFNCENINMRELSMGMSNDFHIAIEEGATIVRIGTKIFGERTCKFK